MIASRLRKNLSVCPVPNLLGFTSKVLCNAETIVYLISEINLRPGVASLRGQHGIPARGIRKVRHIRVDLGRVANALMGGEDIEFFERLKKGGERILYVPECGVYHPVTKTAWIRTILSPGVSMPPARLSDSRAWPKRAVYYFGLPRFYFRDLLENLAKYLYFDSDRRFYYKAPDCILAAESSKRDDRGNASTKALITLRFFVSS